MIMETARRADASRTAAGRTGAVGPARSDRHEPGGTGASGRGLAQAGGIGQQAGG